MNSSDALAALDAHQAAVLAALDHALGLAQSPPEAVRVELAKARWDLVRQARAYQHFKHREIFDPGILSGTPEQALAAQRMKDACLLAGATIEEHAVEWMGKDLVAEWPAYRAALQTLATAMCSHIAGERGEIAALLAVTPLPRRYAAAG